MREPSPVQIAPVRRLGRVRCICRVAQDVGAEEVLVQQPRESEAGERLAPCEVLVEQLRIGDDASRDLVDPAPEEGGWLGCGAHVGVPKEEALGPFLHALEDLPRRE